MELLTLNRLLEPLHTMSEQLDTMSEQLERRDAELREVRARMLSKSLFFRPDGRPVKPVGRLLFHTSGAPRPLSTRFGSSQEWNSEKGIRSLDGERRIFKFIKGR
jgi:hypothetical protein